jgi:long-chain acyl-CoA synthetase
MLPVPSESIVAYLLAARDADPQAWFAYRSNGEVTTYAEAVARIAAIVEWLEGLRIRRGEAVPCYLDDQLPSLYFILACAVLGAVPAPLSPAFSCDYFLRDIVRPLGARAVFTTRKHAAVLCGRGVRVLCFDERSSDDGQITVLDADAALDTTKAREALAARASAVSGDDVFMIQPTAGSTGAPKLVLRRHRAFARYARFVGDQIALGSGEQRHRFLVAAALTHAFGLHMLTTCLRLGAALAIPTALDTAVSLAEVRALGPTVLPLVPRVQRSLHCQAERLPAGRIFGESARFICSAGGTADRGILECFEREGIQIIEFYGSSEASIVAVTPAGGWRPPFAGRLVPDVDVRIADDGELLVKSPGVTDGYVGDDDATRRAFTGGYYCTGDFGEVTPDGYLRVLGRKCDVFNTPEGSNIHPRRIEEMIERISWIDQVVLVGDQRPFIAALVVVSPTLVPPQERCAEAEPLDPIEHAALYARTSAVIADINGDLERIEQVVRIAIMPAPLPAEVYAVVGAGKVRRNRRALATTYARAIEWLYAPVEMVDASFLPKRSEHRRDSGGEGVAETARRAMSRGPVTEAPSATRKVRA